MTIKQKKVAFYIRTENKSDEEVKTQENRLLQVSDAFDYLIYDFYIDNGYSSNSDRPEFKRMLEDMKNGKFDLILSISFDRITRSIAELNNFIELVEKSNCDFITVNENIELKSMLGKMFKIFNTLYSNLELAGVENEQ